MMLQRPTAVGVLLCEQVIVEEGTKNLTLVNSFSRRTVRSFPAEPFSFTVFALLTDGLGDVTIDVVISRLDTMEDLYQRSRSYRFTDPLDTVRVTVRVRDFSFPEPGRYRVALSIENELIAHRNLLIRQRENLS
jgi:hypothetical protein